ncbi:MAG: hypothetical protein M3Q49_05890 [Actinomycetota bacterium]|jgi:hypothetical protein|nr:hypothetical protein [Actinomycetota bacterium]
MTERKLTEAEALGLYAKAQQDEAEARVAGDLAGIDEAKAVQVRALDALQTARLPEAEPAYTLYSPNPHATLTDAQGVTFVDGRATGVPESLARKYRDDFGYRAEPEGEGAS